MSSPDGIPGLQIVNVMSLAESEHTTIDAQPGGQENNDSSPSEEEEEVLLDDDKDYVERTIHECKRCGKYISDLSVIVLPTIYDWSVKLIPQIATKIKMVKCNYMLLNSAVYNKWRIPGLY